MAIRKREPLRIPQSWKDQARAFVIQLERILDDIYKRFFATEIPMSDKDSRTISDSFADLDAQVNITNDILADALLTDKTKFFRSSTTTAYTGSVPNSNFKKSVFIVHKRISGTYVVAINDAREMATNYHNGTSWAGWKQIANTDIRGRIESGTTNNTDLDNCIYAGTYLYNPNSLHIPYASYGLCVVVATNDPTSTGVGWVNQIAISTSGTSPDIYVRKRINGGSAWTSWIRLADVNSLAVRAVNSRTTYATVTLYRCTGTLANALYCHSEGNVLYYEGRITVTDFVRTGANPGFSITLPSGKKLAKDFGMCVGITYSTNEGVRANEMINIVGVKDNTAILVQTTETYTNLSGGSRVTFVLYPVPIEVY